MPLHTNSRQWAGSNARAGTRGRDQSIDFFVSSIHPSRERWATQPNWLYYYPCATDVCAQCSMHVLLFIVFVCARAMAHTFAWCLLRVFCMWNFRQGTKRVCRHATHIGAMLFRLMAKNTAFGWDTSILGIFHACVDVLVWLVGLFVRLRLVFLARTHTHTDTSSGAHFPSIHRTLSALFRIDCTHTPHTRNLWNCGWLFLLKRLARYPIQSVSSVHPTDTERFSLALLPSAVCFFCFYSAAKSICSKILQKNNL